MDGTGLLPAPGLLITALAFLAVLGPLVFVHEMGHYLVGRWCGVKVDAFSIGFGRRLFGWTDRHGTEWKVGWLPLGGYVQFAGDRDTASTPDAAWKHLPDDIRSRSFPAQPVWKRALIVAAGPATNFLFAILILAGFAAVYGVREAPPVVNAVVEGSPADRAGLQSGDRIVAIDGSEIVSFGDISSAIIHRIDEPARIDFVRAGREQSVTMTPRIETEKDRFGNAVQRAVIGIRSGPLEDRRVGPVEALSIGVSQTVTLVRQMAAVIGQLVTGRRDASEMGGPLMIAKESGQMASFGPAALIALIALVSVNLGFINLLPMPMLDGGHLVFYAYEAVRGKPASAEVQAWAFRAGFLALVALMLFTTFNDLSRFGLWNAMGRLIG